jgi:MYXO-CTERM domain-containing protein
VIRRRISIVGCLLAAYAAMGARRAKADALIFGPEIAVDEPVLSPVLATRSPKVAFNGTNYLVVWSDPRGGSAADDVDTSIFAARVSTSGTLLDPLGIVVSDGTGIVQDQTGLTKGHPAIAFDGANYLVVWMDIRDRSAQVYGARINPAGQVLDPDGFRISTAAIEPTEPLPVPNGQEDPTVAFDGTRFLVAWSDARRSLTSGRDIYAAHVTTQGSVVEAGGFVITEEAGDQVLPVAASAGAGQAAVTWTTGTSTGVFAARVSAAGTVLDTVPIVLSTAAIEASVTIPRRAITADANGYLVAWCASDPSVAICDVTARRIDAAGQLGAPIVVATGVYDSLSLSGATGGAQSLLLWNGNNGQTSLMRLSAAGALVDPAGGLSVPGLPVPGAVASGSGNRLLVVGRPTAAVDNLVSATLDTNAPPTAGATVAVAVSANVESGPAAAFDGAGYLVTWSDLRVAAGAMMANRLDASGAPRSPTAFKVADGSFSFPVVASDGTDFMVGWRAGSSSMSSGLNVNLQPVTGAGALPGPATAIGQSDPYAPANIALVFGGAGYFVFWSELGPVPVRASIRAARLGTNAAVTARATITLGLPSTKPAAACAPNRCLLAFVESPQPGPSPSYSGPGAIRGVFLDDGLAPAPTALFTIAPIAGVPLQSPQVAFDGTNWLVTWQDADGHMLRGARVDTNAKLLDTTQLVIADSQTLGKVSASFDGTDYLVAWESGGLRAARISKSGTVLDPGGVAGPTGSSPALAGRLLAYNRPVSGRSRVLVRLRVPPTVVDGGIDEPIEAGTDGPPDGSADVAQDASVDVAQDASVDVAQDAPVDVAQDASVDLGEDASADAEPDASIDVGRDASDDAATDAGQDASADAGQDAPADAGQDAAHDATAHDAGTDGSAEKPSGGGAGCACDVGGGSTPRAGGLLFLALLAVVLRARRATAAHAPRTPPRAWRRALRRRTASGGSPPDPST